jgi:hypothetical protein
MRYMVGNIPKLTLSLHCAEFCVLEGKFCARRWLPTSPRRTNASVALPELLSLPIGSIREFLRQWAMEELVSG